MDDQTHRPKSEGAAAGAASDADETFGWTAEAADGGREGAGGAAERMLAQLQSMIDSLATQAAPVARQIGAKAAELAAAAADKAGPIAHKAADVTADASVRLAERSRGLAAELRRSTNGEDGAAATGTAVLDGIDDATEQAAADDPAEGAR